MKKVCALVLAVVLIWAVALPAGAVDLQLAAPSAVLMDLTTGTVLYEANAHQPMAPASVTKVMTLLLIMEAIDSGKIGWQDMVTASEAAAAKGGSQVYLKVGETMSVEEMVKSIAVSSANDCACAMAEYIAGSEAGFVERMNQRAQELGMENTHFVNCTGLDDDPSAAEHLTTAYDIAVMSRELLLNHPDIKRFTTIWMDTVRNGSFGLSNTNKLVRFYEGTTGLKTGYTSSAGHCLSASAQRDGLELVAVVLHCASSADRFQSAKALLDYGFANYALVPVQDEAALPAVPVVLGAQEEVKPVISGPEQLLIAKEQKQSITRGVTLEPSVQAPVSQGQRLGTLTVRAGDEVLAEVPLVAETAVTRLTWKDLFLDFLGRAAMAADAS
ncbi:MAG TPA: D-alanyl-D-alanine carboxypeptidase [Candidatus Faecousia faecigallinarum]|nr:D-alanyl-D-alanine carboxypeptidase [Candidatus Faecousia faecigallinarum]